MPIKSIFIFCDGACSGNPGPGGWGAIVTTPDGKVTELGGRVPTTTNNQMELLATIRALESIDGLKGDVDLFTDSTYVIKGITEWIWGWRRRGWKSSEGKDVLNRELWESLSSVVQSRSGNGKINWKYIRGHTGVPGNERADEIAVAFSQNRNEFLFRGNFSEYGIAITTIPADCSLPKMKLKEKKKEAPHSYLSLVGNIPYRHATWADCEKRVKGQSGAKFKKTKSSSDEVEILTSWGVDPKKLT